MGMEGVCDQIAESITILKTKVLCYAGLQLEANNKICMHIIQRVLTIKTV